MKTTRRIIGTCSILIALPVVLIATTVFIDMIVRGTTNNEAFDSQTWKTGTYRDRGTMINDLMDSDTLIGLPEQAIIALLDTADMPAGHIHENSWAYWVNEGGITGLFPIHDLLIIAFDSTTGRCSEAYITAP